MSAIAATSPEAERLHSTNSGHSADVHLQAFDRAGMEVRCFLAYLSSLASS